LRDALPFVRFSDFVNQIDFAAVASELNARALASSLDRLDPARLKGKIISFRGATVVGPELSPVLEIVPITLRLEGSGP
jgi:predicted lipoprotein